MAELIKLTGKGFLVWKLTSVLPISRMITALKRADCSWVCIKVVNGLLKSNFNEEIGFDPGLKEVIQQLKDAGFKVGGWAFIFTSNIAKPGPQAALLGERVQKLDLDFVMIDVEENQNVGALWKTGSTRNQDAKIYVSQLRAGGVPLRMPALFCSYRFPYMHIELPYSAFLKSDSVNGIAQQLYWVDNDNPREQLIQSIEEYDDWGHLYEDMIPIGAAFGEHGWVVEPEQITEFVHAVKEFGLGGCGFWSLDKAINEPEWLDAIADGNSPPLPPVPPDPPGNEVTMEEWANEIDTWARTMGYDGVKPPGSEPEYFTVMTNTGSDNLLVRADKNGAIIDRLPNGSVVDVYPPTFLVGGYTRGEIDAPSSNRWIALEFTIQA